MPAYVARGLQELLDFRRRSIFASAPVKILVRRGGRGEPSTRAWQLQLALNSFIIYKCDRIA
jgi:hypothetical protein